MGGMTQRLEAGRNRLTMVNRGDEKKENRKQKWRDGTGIFRPILTKMEPYWAHRQAAVKEVLLQGQLEKLVFPIRTSSFQVHRGWPFYTWRLDTGRSAAFYLFLGTIWVIHWACVTTTKAIKRVINKALLACGDKPAHHCYHWAIYHIFFTLLLCLLLVFLDSSDEISKSDFWTCVLWI